RLRQAVSLVTQSYVNEWFLIFRDDYRNPPASTVKSGDLVPDYVLKPRDWPLESRLTGLPAIALAKTTTPVLSWEKLPATIPEKYFQSDDPRARNLVYDVRVYAASKASGVFPAEIVVS